MTDLRKETGPLYLWVVLVVTRKMRLNFSNEASPAKMFGQVAFLDDDNA